MIYRESGELSCFGDISETRRPETRLYATFTAVAINQDRSSDVIFDIVF